MWKPFSGRVRHFVKTSAPPWIFWEEASSCGLLLVWWVIELPIYHQRLSPDVTRRVRNNTWMGQTIGLRFVFSFKNLFSENPFSSNISFPPRLGWRRHYTWTGQTLSHFGSLAGQWLIPTTRYIENDHPANTKYKYKYKRRGLFYFKFCQIVFTNLLWHFGWHISRLGMQEGLNTSTHDRFWNINLMWCTHYIEDLVYSGFRKVLIEFQVWNGFLEIFLTFAGRRSPDKIPQTLSEHF